MLGSLTRIALRPFGLELRRSHWSDPFWVQSQLVTKQDPVIFDIGAAVGDISATYRGLFPNCALHAFEPFPESCRKLESRFKSCPGFKVNQMAVGETDGMASLTSNKSPFTNSVLQTDPRASQSWGEGVLDTTGTVQVSMTTLDTYCRKNAIATVDILKLDIQGGELKALQGARSLLESGRIGLIYLEVILVPTYVGQPGLEDYLSFLRPLGYAMLDFYNPSRTNLRLLQCDLIFVREPASRVRGSNPVGVTCL